MHQTLAVRSEIGVTEAPLCEPVINRADRRRRWNKGRAESAIRAVAMLVRPLSARRSDNHGPFAKRATRTRHVTGMLYRFTQRKYFGTRPASPRLARVSQSRIRHYGPRSDFLTNRVVRKADRE